MVDYLQEHYKRFKSRQPDPADRNIRMTVNITEGQKKQIEQEARSEERSESFIVRRIIEKYFGDKK